MGLSEMFKKEDFDDLKVGECMEMSMKGTEDGKTEEMNFMLACRTDKDTVKIKTGMIDEDFDFELVMKKRPMKKGDFKK